MFYHIKLDFLFFFRYKIGDFNGQILAEVSALRHIKPTATYLPINHHLMRTEKMLNRPKVIIFFLLMILIFVFF